MFTGHHLHQINPTLNEVACRSDATQNSKEGKLMEQVYRARQASLIFPAFVQMWADAQPLCTMIFPRVSINGVGQIMMEAHPIWHMSWLCSGLESHHSIHTVQQHPGKYTLVRSRATWSPKEAAK